MKCKLTESASSSNCTNCERLGLDCRWNPPAPGDNFEPPPKRRRRVAAVDQTKNDFTDQYFRSPDIATVATSSLVPIPLPNHDLPSTTSAREDISTLGIHDESTKGSGNDWEWNWDLFLPPGNYETEMRPPAPAFSQILDQSFPALLMTSSPIAPMEQHNTRLIQHYLEVSSQDVHGS